MLVLQPLIQGLRGTALFYRVYEDKNKVLTLEVGNHLKPFWEKDKESLEVIFGNPPTKKEITYKIYEDHWERSKVEESNHISDSDIQLIERFLDSCYNFEETHKVVDYK